MKIYLSNDEIQLLLDSLACTYGPGWSLNRKVAGLQMKLSIQLEIQKKAPNQRMEPTTKDVAAHP